MRSFLRQAFFQRIPRLTGLHGTAPKAPPCQRPATLTWLTLQNREPRRTSCRKDCTKAERLELSTGGSPSTSLTMIGATWTCSELSSIRWKTTFSICVSEAFAVVWCVSALDIRKML